MPSKYGRTHMKMYAAWRDYGNDLGVVGRLQSLAKSASVPNRMPAPVSCPIEVHVSLYRSAHLPSVRNER